MKRERTALTQRERQCQKVARDKARSRFMHACWVRVRIGLAVIGVCLLTSAGWWEYRERGISRIFEQTVAGVYNISGRMGFTLEALYLEGRSRTPRGDVQKALSVKQGTPIFLISLDEVRERLEKIPTVKQAMVERSLPSTLHVRLVERDPVAIWQDNGKLSLIDDEGTVMTDLALADYANLPLVVGSGAPKHVKEVLALLAAQPDLQPMVEAAVRVGDRRWNIKLKGGVEVKLPENDDEAAWQRVAQMQREQGILDRAIRAVDLRQKDRMYIKLAPEAIPSASPASARET